MEADMLKKLVKYGNSNALVLDRPILELLSIGEGSLVKLHTDGKSLIITPHQAEESVQPFSTGMEMLQEAVIARSKEQIKEWQANPVTNKQLEECGPGSETVAQLTELFKPIMEKYRTDFAFLQTEAFAQDIEALGEKYQSDKTSPEYLKEFFAIRLKHAPRLADMDKEMAEAQEKIMKIQEKANSSKNS